MTPLWTAAEAAAATGGRATRDWVASGVATEGKSVAPGDLFIAFAGPEGDGHGEVAGAFAKGAAAAVVTRLPPDVAETAPLLIVGDTMAALAALGLAGRRRSTAQIVGIAGSVGKTATKEALTRALERQGTVFAGSWGRDHRRDPPLALARLPRDSAWAVFELGETRPGAIGGLSRMIEPDVAVITAGETAAAGDVSAVAALSEIFSGMTAHGAAVLNRDNPHFAHLAAAARAHGITRILGFGAHAEAPIRLIDSHLYASASAVTASVMGEIVDYCVAIPGRHWVINSLAVLGAVKALGGDVGAAAAAMSSLQPGERRSGKPARRLAGRPVATAARG